MIRIIKGIFLYLEGPFFAAKVILKLVCILLVLCLYNASCASGHGVIMFLSERTGR